jgi:hypothetical protein
VDLWVHEIGPERVGMGPRVAGGASSSNNDPIVPGGGPSGEGVHVALSVSEAAHLIRRAGFGVTAGWLGEIRSHGSREAAVDRMLDVSRSPSDALAPGVEAFPLSTEGGYFGSLLAEWWLDRMATSPVPLVEKLTLFWHGHFVSAMDKVTDMSLLLHQHRLLRAGALGSFHDLVQAVSVDPAMLLYLDNASNVAADPQENFGRELLEVFTLGPAQRSEADVVAMTRAWTGHGLTSGNRVYRFDPKLHDSGPKTLFGLPPKDWNGPEAVTELLFGARAGESSRFITAKLFSYLAYPVTTDDPVVHRLAEGFRTSRLSLHALVRSILLSDEFWSPAARGALVRSPVEWVVAILQALGQSATVAKPEGCLTRAGQVLFNPPTVAGWGQNRYWVSTVDLWGKADFAVQARQLAANNGILADVAGLDPAGVATRGFQQFGIVEPSPGTRAVVERWVAAARKQKGGPELVARNLVHLMVLSPEFQLA